MDIATIISNNLKTGEHTSPVLFVWQNLEMVNASAASLAKEICSQHDVPHAAFSTCIDNGDTLKIWQIKEFFKKSELSSPYTFQIFLLENISRMTLSAANSCLKLFEEPWVQNIIFLTNVSESQILDTIISRVQISYIEWKMSSWKSDFYFGLIHQYRLRKDPEIFAYFFRNKLEKSDYLDFLHNIIQYAQEYSVYIHLLEDLHEDIGVIQANNVNAKWVVDSYLFKL